MISVEQLYSQTIYVGGIPVPRFPPSTDYVCPNCGGNVLEDNWPPNYWSYSGGGKGHTLSADQKCICLACAIQFVMHTYENSSTEIKQFTVGTGWTVVPLSPKRVWAEGIEPLTERDGKYLTKDDIWTDDYAKEHGEPPDVAYG